MNGGAAIEQDPRRTGTVGVIGGMGPLATADFYRRLTEATLARRDQDHLHVIIDSQPAVPDRTAHVLLGGADPAPMIVESARRLEAAGAGLLVIACNTAHVVAEEVRASVSVPVVDWTDETAAVVVSLRPGLRAVGLLATDGTIEARLYHDVFGRRGVTVIAPLAQAQRVVMDAIYGPEGMKSGTPDAARQRDELGRVAAALGSAGADIVLLACTELSLLDAMCPRPWPVPTFDAADLVARRVVELAGGTLRRPLDGRARDEVRTAR